MAGTDADVIDALVGITPGSPLDAIRARRPEARAHAQATYRALFAPETPGHVTAQERFAVGGFVAGLHGATSVAAYYAERLASVHARHAATYSKRESDVQRLLDAGVTADLGERWNAIVAASVALTATPSAFGPEHVERLRRSGLDDLAIADVVHAAAFFNWANRLMLSLGEPAAPAGA